MEWTYESCQPDDTFNLGAMIGSLVEGGELICLVGELGAGKTLLTQGIARGLDIQERVSSPTFTIVCEYEGRIALVHMDLYRLDEPIMLEDIGFEEYLHHGAVTVIEWAEKAGPFLPAEHLLIQVVQSAATDSEKRVMTLSANDPKHQRILKGLMGSAGIRNRHCDADGQHWAD